MPEGANYWVDADGTMGRPVRGHPDKVRLGSSRDGQWVTAVAIGAARRVGLIHRHVYRSEAVDPLHSDGHSARPGLQERHIVAGPGRARVAMQCLPRQRGDYPADTFVLNFDKPCSSREFEAGGVSGRPLQPGNVRCSLVWCGTVSDAK